LEQVQHLIVRLAIHDLDLNRYHLTMSQSTSFSIPDSPLTILVHFGECPQLKSLFIS